MDIQADAGEPGDFWVAIVASMVLFTNHVVKVLKKVSVELTNSLVVMIIDLFSIVISAVVRTTIILLFIEYNKITISL